MQVLSVSGHVSRLSSRKAKRRTHNVFGRAGSALVGPAMQRVAEADVPILAVVSGYANARHATVIATTILQRRHKAAASNGQASYLLAPPKVHPSVPVDADGISGPLPNDGPVVGIPERESKTAYVAVSPRAASAAPTEVYGLDVLQANARGEGFAAEHPDGGDGRVRQVPRYDQLIWVQSRWHFRHPRDVPGAQTHSGTTQILDERPKKVSGRDIMREQAASRHEGRVAYPQTSCQSCDDLPRCPGQRVYCYILVA
jgi:hypothetical protein